MYDAVNVVMEGLPDSLFSHHVNLILMDLGLAKETDNNIDK